MLRSLAKLAGDANPAGWASSAPRPARWGAKSPERPSGDRAACTVHACTATSELFALLKGVEEGEVTVVRHIDDPKLRPRHDRLPKDRLAKARLPHPCTPWGPVLARDFAEPHARVEDHVEGVRG